MSRSKVRGAARWAAVAALLSAPGCRYRVAPPPPEERAPTTFPHAKHAEIACADCHTAIPTETRLGQAKLPGVDTCGMCHDRSTPALAAKFSPPKRQPREYALRFDHEAHLKRVPNGDCTYCHKQLPPPGAPWKTSPPMSACTRCHVHEVDFAQANCRRCHISLKRFPLKPVSQYAHTANWIEEHGNAASTSAETCAACHDQTYCARCHATSTNALRPEIRFPEQVESDFIHRGDFLSRHQIEAQNDPASCRKCHGSFFCESCHTQQGLVAGVPNARNPHPPGWMTPGSGQFHGDAARDDILSCAACHDQGPASICVSCHKVGGSAGVNIHPPGFRQTDTSKPMCRICHTNG
jgi:Cytochrome c7 and related cytochrome c/Class III cytochrome C family